MNDKLLTAFFILCLIAVIGFMSWRDMNPKVSGEEAGPALSFAYHIGPGITPAMVPDDNLPVTISIGRFNFSGQEPVWIPEGASPATFVHRQVSLLLRFDGLPQDPVETVRKSRELVTEWEGWGNAIAGIFIDYRPENPDFTAYTGFLSALHREFQASHGLVIVIDAAWLTEPYKSRLEEIADYTSLFLVDMPAQIPSALFSLLENFGHGFIIRFPTGVRPADIDQAALQKLKFLGGFGFVLDAAQPWPKKEEKIGLFPKF